MANKDSTSNRTTQKVCKVSPEVPKARTRRKTKAVSVIPNVVANIVFIPPETRKQQAHENWNIALRAYLNTLSNDETTLVNKCIAFIVAKPERRNYLHGKCPVIPFPVVGKTQQQRYRPIFEYMQQV